MKIWQGVILLCGILGVAFIGIVTLEKLHSSPLSQQPVYTDIQAKDIVTITFESGAVIHAEIADTPAKQAKGLGGRSHLTDAEGMLFPYNIPSRPVFWMKGMEIPIDILWIKDATVIGIEHAVAPEPGISDQDLTRYSPDQAIDYVLEVRGGLSRDFGITNGTTVLITE